MIRNRDIHSRDLDYMHRIIGTLLVIILFLVKIGIIIPSSIAMTNESPSYISHIPIRINSDSDFITKNGVINGSGKWNDPYIIEGWDINGTNYGYSLYIGNTTSYFIVRNNYLHYYTDKDHLSNVSSNIILYNVTNGKIIDNVIIGNSQGSLNLYYSENISIMNNRIDGIIQLYSSNYNNIIGNVPSKNFNSIYLESSNNNNISKNNVSGNSKASRAGIFLMISYNNNIIENIVFNNSNGIYLRLSSSNNIIGNVVMFNSISGIMIEDSYDNNLQENKLSSNGIVIYGKLLSHWNTHNIDSSNLVNNKPIYYYKNQDNGIVPKDAGQIILANSKHIVIDGCTIAHASVAIELGFSTANSITNNNIIGNINGVYMYSSDGNKIENNNVHDNTIGISLDSSNNNEIIRNIILNNSGSGIYVGYSINNTLKNNDISRNRLSGIEMWYSNRNIIVMNNLTGNVECGIQVGGSSNFNHIHHNNFIANRDLQGYDDSNGNLWNDTHEGNYWSDFDEPSEGCIDTNFDGICDSPYPIAGDTKARDYYPLIWKYPTSPTVVATDPENGSASVDIASKIIIIFSRQMDRNATENAIKVTPGVIIKAEWDNYGKELYLTVSLEERTTYTIKISTDAKDFVGNHMEKDYTFTFTTKSKTTNSQWMIPIIILFLITVIALILMFILFKRERKRTTQNKTANEIRKEE